MNYTLIYESFVIAITSISMGLVMANSFVKKKGSKLRCFLFLAIPKLIQLYSQYYIQNIGNTVVASSLMGIATLFIDFALFFVVFNGTFQEVIVAIVSCELASLPMSLFRDFIEKKFTVKGQADIFVPGLKEFILISFGYILTVTAAVVIAMLMGKILVKINYNTKIFNIFGVVGMIFFVTFEISVLAGDIKKALNTGTLFRYVLMGLLWVAFFIVMYIINDYFTKKKLRREIEVLNEEKARQFEYYNLVKNHNEEIRKIRHDIKGHISALGSLVERKEYDRVEEYVATLDENFSKIRKVSFTGNITADTVICDIKEKCESENIEFTPKGLLPEKAGIDDVSLTCIMTNVLNNAYEACSRMEKNAEKFIRLDVRVVSGCLVIKCENSKNKDEKVNAKDIKTLKKEPGHGYGMKIINDIVKEKDGAVEIKDEGNTFEIKILMICSET